MTFILDPCSEDDCVAKLAAEALTGVAPAAQATFEESPSTSSPAQQHILKH
jgi:hypothetical protein